MAFSARRRRVLYRLGRQNCNLPLRAKPSRTQVIKPPPPYSPTRRRFRDEIQGRGRRCGAIGKADSGARKAPNRRKLRVISFEPRLGRGRNGRVFFCFVVLTWSQKRVFTTSLRRFCQHNINSVQGLKPK